MAEAKRKMSKSTNNGFLLSKVFPKFWCLKRTMFFVASIVIFSLSSSHAYGEECNVAKILQYPNRIAFSKMKLCSDKGNDLAKYNLAIMYKDGFGCEKNEKEAFSLLLQIDTARLPAAAYALGVFYRDGIGVETNCLKGLDFIIIASISGHIEADYELGRMYLVDSECEKKNLCTAYELLINAYQSGYKEASLYLAHLFSVGSVCTKKSKFKSKEYYDTYYDLNPKENGNVIGANMFLNNNPQKCSEGIDYLKKSYSKGNFYSGYLLGSIHYLGICGDRDYSQAFEYYKRTSVKGVPESKHALAVSYLNGNGVKKDVSKGISILEMLVSDQYVAAMNTLGVYLVLNGDTNKGLTLLEQGAVHCDVAKANLELAKRMKSGEPVTSDSFTMNAIRLQN